MRKLKKELVWGVVRRYNICACNSTFHMALEVSLNCGVFIGAAAEMCCHEKGKHVCIALKVSAV